MTMTMLDGSDDTWHKADVQVHVGAGADCSAATHAETVTLSGSLPDSYHQKHDYHGGSQHKP